MQLDDSHTLRRLRRVFLVMFGLSLVAFVAVTAFVRANPTSTFDTQVAAQFFRDGADSEFVAAVGRALNLLGGNLAGLIIVLVGFFVLRRTKHPLLAAYLVASAVGGFLLSSLIKSVVGRSRPDTVGLLLDESTRSYPSGHATASVTVFGALALICLAVLSPRIRIWVASLLLLFGAIVGLSRVWMGVHWPTDVIGGWLLGATWTSAAAALVITTAIRA